MKVQLENLSKVYYTETIETHALKDITLSIDEGEFVVVNGPSGCGKSTLLAILGLLENPTHGSYLFEGKETTGMKFDQGAMLRREEIGFVFQTFNLVDSETVLENVLLPIRFHRGLNETERENEATTLLDQLGLSHRVDHYPTQLSGGQQQRVAIARALAGNPSLVIADEPTGNLDPDSTDNVIEIFKTLHKQGTTLCVATHNPFYQSIADRTVSLSEGQIA